MDDQDRRAAEIVAQQLRDALSLLARSSARVQELEQNEVLLWSRVGRLEAALQADLNTVTQGREPSLYPAANINRIMRSFSVTQRRDAWRDVLMRNGIEGACTTLFPHAETDDPITILVIGSGGFGDMLYLSALARGLYDRFERARIVVLFEHAGASVVLRSNPYVLDVLTLLGDSRRDFISAAMSLDIFDLVADVRYVVTYATPPLSRIPDEFLRTANSRAVEWQSYVRGHWPRLNNALAREAVRQGMSQFELMSHTGNLPATRLCGDFFPLQELPNQLVVALRGRPYVTLHHGADKAMSQAGGLQTKNLPTGTWIAVAISLRAAGLTTVQLGEQFESLITSVELDLRGQTTFDQTAQVIQGAQLHIDTEGGLVHLARALGVTCVVAFGPTPGAFFGYRGNVNLGPVVCGDCWWVKADWSLRCVRDLDVPECMNSFQPQDITAPALMLAADSKLLRIESSALLGGAAVFHGTPEGSARCAAIVSKLDVLPTLLQGAWERTSEVFVPASELSSLARQLPDRAVRPYVTRYVPADTAAFDWTGVDIRDLEIEDAIDLLCQGIRITKAGGRMMVVGRLSDTGFAELVGTVAGPRLGVRYRIEWPVLDYSDGNVPDGTVPLAMTGTVEQIASSASPSAHVPPLEFGQRGSQPRSWLKRMR